MPPEKGDRIRLKDGREGIVTGQGVPDFPNDPYPVYVQIGTDRTWVMSDDLKVTES